MHSLDDRSADLDERAAFMPEPCDRCLTLVWELHDVDRAGYLVPPNEPGVRRVCGDCVRG